MTTPAEGAAAPASAPAAPAPAPAAPAPAPAAPAPAPVPTPASFAPAPAPAAPGAPDKGVVVEYTPTGDHALDLALHFIGGLGFGPERPEMQAAMRGDLGPLSKSLEALGDRARGFERYVSAAKASFDAKVEREKGAQEAVTKLAVEEAGSIERWNSIHKWASEVADPGEKVQIDSALKAGGQAARAMVKYLSDLYAQSGLDKAPAKSPLKAGAAGAAPDSEALTAAEYQAEIRKLRTKYGNRLDEQPEYKELTRRRLATQRNERQGA